jgi:hypothetical protein
MVTAENFAYLVQTLDKEVLDQIASGVFEKDYIAFELHITNAGGYASFENVDYCKDKKEECEDNGNLFCDVDDFLLLCNETQALEF